MRAVPFGVLLLALGAWTADASAQGAPPPPPPPLAPAASPAPPPPPPSASTPTPTPTPAPAPAPTPSTPPSPFPPSNGHTADLLSPTFGSPHPHVTPGGAQRTWGIVSGVFGVLFIAGGVGWSSLAKSLYDDSNKPGICVNNVCTADGLVDRANARTVGDVATASFVGGSLLVGTGALLFFTAASPSETTGTALQVTPGGLRLRGTW